MARQELSVYWVRRGDSSPQEKAEHKQGAVGAAGTGRILTGDSRQGFPEEAFELGLGERVR